MGVNITSSGNLIKEIKTQAQKVARVVSYLNYLVWRSKYMRKKRKEKNIYKANVPPIMAYALETRAETYKTR